jgi:hypothetical protein
MRMERIVMLCCFQFNDAFKCSGYVAVNYRKLEAKELERMWEEEVLVKFGYSSGVFRKN